MANIYLSSLFSCLVGVIRTVRCVPFSPIISAINAAQQDSSRAINTSPGPHTASTSSPRHSLMMEKKSNVFLPPFFLTFSQNHEKKSASLQKLHIHLAEKMHLHLSITHVLEGVRGNDRCLSDHPLAQVFCWLHQGHWRWLHKSIRARMQKGHFIRIHYKWIYILCLGPRTRFVSQCKYLSLNVDSSFFLAKKEKCFRRSTLFCAVLFLIRHHQSSWGRFVVQIERFVIIS